MIKKFVLVPLRNPRIGKDTGCTGCRRVHRKYGLTPRTHTHSTINQRGRKESVQRSVNLSATSPTGWQHTFFVLFFSRFCYFFFSLSCSFFFLFRFFCFYRLLSFIGCVCRACCIQYDYMAVHCLLCLLHSNAVRLRRGYMITELVYLYYRIEKLARTRVLLDVDGYIEITV